MIEAIQSSGFQSVWAVTGGGVGAVHAMLAHPGASRFVLDIRIPYSPDALAGFLGKTPASSCSEDAARAMAQVAFDHASSLTHHALGIACTAALQTKRTRRGADRAHICIQSAGQTVCEKVDVAPGSRSQQDAFLSGVLLDRIAEFVGADQ
ncbi:hypothetical protein [Pontiella desulfatans]|uniref:hypothetical protein n=1 Tax=Pontiella desulfatans TaxID=2750659 RepID=UPI00109CB047|nr:hypothetical protein [Pontiella desulfatans]